MVFIKVDPRKQFTRGKSKIKMIHNCRVQFLVTMVQIVECGGVGRYHRGRVKSEFS